MRNYMCFKKVCEKLSIPDHKRFRWGFWIIFLSLLSLFLVVFFCSKKFFYNEAINGFGNIYRFLWVLPFLFVGFSFLAFWVAKSGSSKDDPPWSSYIFSYFPRLIALSLIIFSMLHVFSSTSNYLYYFFSAGLGLYLGYNVDWVKPEELLGKILGKSK